MAFRTIAQRLLSVVLLIAGSCAVVWGLGHRAWSSGLPINGRVVFLGLGLMLLGALLAIPSRYFLKQAKTNRKTERQELGR